MQNKDKGVARECMLISRVYAELHAEDLLRSMELVVLPMQQPDPDNVPFQDWTVTNVLADTDTERITGAYCSEDLQMSWATLLAFFGAVKAAPNCRWQWYRLMRDLI
jgi:hypothetical protein